MTNRNYRVKAILCIIAFSHLNIHAQTDMQKMADLETQTNVAQKELALLQARAAIHQFKGTGGQPLPQIISLYGSTKGMRALVDLGVAGVREVGEGDLLSGNMKVASIDIISGIEVSVKGTKATFHLAMKSMPIPQTPSPTTTSVQTQGIQPTGYPMGPTLVPPIQPMQ